MDINRLTQGEKIVLGSSALLVVLSFIPLWATYSFAGLASESFSAWSGAFGFFVKLAIILSIVALVMTVLRATGTQLPELPVGLGLLYVGLGGLTLLGLLIGVLAGPADGGLALAAAAGLDVSRGILLFVGVILAAAMAFGGYMHMQTEDTSPAVGGPSTPPPPPV